MTIVDDDDFWELSKHKWYCSGQGYAVRTIGQKPHQYNIRMSRIIINAPDGMQVDHIDGDPLNNQKNNLRLCTNADNSRNSRKQRRVTSSRFKGVCWHKIGKKWMASIEANGNAIYLGLFNNEEEAAHAYDQSATKLFGEFARLNF